jgi:hypothetical protein
MAGSQCLQVNDQTRSRNRMALAAADVDGDGLAELAVGTPYWSGPGDTYNGRFQTFEPGEPGLYIGDGLYAEPHRLFGTAVVSGDFDDDGIPDFAIGANEFGAGQGGYVMVRASCGEFCWEAAMTLRQGSAGLADTSEASDRFGEALAGGDFDGDGHDDLAVGVPGESWIGVSGEYQGAVHVVYGSATGLNGSRDVLFGEHDLGTVRESGDRFGEALAAGDLDGDGYDDLAIGAPYENYAGIASAGMVFVVFGSADGLDFSRRQVWTQNSAGIADTAEEDDRFGAVLAIGDLDRQSLFGTSRADLVIAAPNEEDGATFDAGTVHVLYSDAAGPSATGSLQLFRPGGSVQGGEFGKTLLAARFGSDAAADLVVSAPWAVSDNNHRGEVFLYLGAAGAPLVPPGNAPWRPAGPSCAGAAPEAEQFGAALVAGDFNHDGRRDLGIGVPQWSPNEPGEDFGLIEILFGTPMLFSDSFETGTVERWSAGGG